MSTIKEMIHLHLDQAYAGETLTLELGAVMKRYSLLPNETLYIIDCQRAELICPDGKFEKVTGMSVSEMNDLHPLYEHIETSQIDTVMNFQKKVVMEFGFNKHWLMGDELDWINVIYKTIHGKVLLKSTSGLLRDSRNMMCYSIGRLMDITDLGHNGKFSYRFTGNHAEEMDAAIPKPTNETPLSLRETEILTLIGKGMKSDQIANMLSISKCTVDTHRKNILRKLGVSGSLNAYNKANNLGLLN